MLGVGFALAPDAEFLALLGQLIEEDADYYEVTPETLWRVGMDGHLEGNGFRARFLELRQRTRRPFVAHGVGFSLGAMSEEDGARRRQWLLRMREEQAAFELAWWTDHLGASVADGLALTLPMPLPMTSHAEHVVRRRMAAMSSVVPLVGFENTMNYFVWGKPLDEPAFITSLLRGASPSAHMLLDLHNVYTFALNFGIDPAAYIEALPLERVIEIHVSGGAEADPRWTRGARPLRLDSHDQAVPEPVWGLLEAVAPRCPHLRGVTLERMEGTVTSGDVALLREEMKRIRFVTQRLG